MTKKQEIEILHETITKLGPDSYCGPWLESVLSEVESEMRSDFLPTPSLWVTKKECADLVNAAKLEAGKLVQDALATAERMRAACRRDLDAAIVTAIEKLNAARIR